MGGVSSKDDGSESRWGVFLLCGGADNVVVDEKDSIAGASPPPFLQNYARRSQRFDSNGVKNTPSKRELRESKRVAESATSFLREFKQAMKGRGFTAIKYGRKGKPSARVFRLDETETCIVWNTSKLSTKRRLNGARIDTVPLLEIAEVARGADSIPFDVAPEISKCCLSLRCGGRQLALQLDSEQNRELIADGISLLVAEAVAAKRGGDDGQ